MNDFDVPRVSKIVAATAKRKLPLFRAFRGSIDEQDLVQVGLDAALKVHVKFDASRAAYSTWITRAAGFAMLDLLKRRRREQERINVLRVMAWAQEVGGRQRAVGGVEEERPADVADLPAWLAGVYAAARGARPRVRRRGRRGYSPAAALAVGLLMRRLKLSSRGAELLLGQRADLRLAVAMRRVPSQPWFGRALRAVNFVSDNAEAAAAVDRVSGPAAANNEDGGP